MGIRGQYKNKRDANEPEIFDILRAWGIQVEPLDVPCDAVCGYRGNNYLVEIKNGDKAPMTKSQAKFHADWNGDIVTLRTVDEAQDWARGVHKSGAVPFRGQIL